MPGFCPEPFHPPRADSLHPSVLVVDPDPGNEPSWRLFLEHYGYPALVTRTLRDAIGTLIQRPEYVLVDARLPDGEGVELLERIRKRRLPIRVAILTDSRHRASLRRILRHQPNALLFRPVDYLLLLRQLRAGLVPRLDFAC